MLVGQRTQAINALRGHATEFGIVVAKGCSNVAALLATLSTDKAIPNTAKSMFEQMGKHVTDFDEKIAALDQRLGELHETNPVSQRLSVTLVSGGQKILDGKGVLGKNDVYAPKNADHRC
jgi:transposase